MIDLRRNVDAAAAEYVVEAAQHSGEVLVHLNDAHPHGPRRQRRDD